MDPWGLVGWVILIEIWKNWPWSILNNMVLYVKDKRETQGEKLLWGYCMPQFSMLRFEGPHHVMDLKQVTGFCMPNHSAV